MVRFQSIPVAIIGLTVMGAPALCQTRSAQADQRRSPRTERSDDVGNRDRLTYVVAVSEALDSELPPEFQRLADQEDWQSGGLSSSLVTATDYVRNRRRTQLTANALTSFRYFPRTDRLTSVSHRAEVAAAARLPKQGTLQFRQTAAYAPDYMFQLFPTAAGSAAEVATPTDPNYRVDQRGSYSYATTTELAFGSVRRTRVAIFGEHRRTDFQRSTASRPDLRIYATGAKASRAVSRNGRLLLEYQYRTGEYGFIGQTDEHRVTMGVEYSRPLSGRRHATFRFNSSPAMLVLPESAVAARAALPIPAAEGNGPAAVDPRLYRMQGEASLDYQFQQHWRTAWTYRRSMEYLAMLPEPVFSDGARAELTGAINRRVGVSATASFANGQSAFSRAARHLETYSGYLRILFELRPSVGVFSTYQYYYYDLRGQARLASDLPSVFEQQGFRVGFMLWGRALGR
jgi:hypothetical protein